MTEMTINPYNFVPLKTAPDRSQGYTGLDRFQDGSYRGILECRLLSLGPLVSVDHRSFSMHELKNLDGTRVRVPSGRRKGELWAPIKVFRFLRNSRNEPIIQGSSLKGMVRTVYEAMVDGCLALVAHRSGNPNPYNYTDPTTYRNNACNTLTHLCLACRLFGTIEGDAIHCQGRVRFTDAVLTKGELERTRLYLRELSTPKPYHYGTYGKGGKQGGEIAGRKFYYHHDVSTNFSISEEASNDRSSAIDEFAPVRTEFSFQVFIEDLSPDELGRLIHALELDEGLGHKIGMGKAVGLGSCKIIIDESQSRLFESLDRYRSWERASAPSAPTWGSLRAGRETLPPELIEVLRLNKPEEGSLGYPGRPYPKQSIDARGVFGGTATTGARPRQAEARAAGPIGVPPNVRQSEQAVWLRELFEKELVLVTLEGKDVRRPRSAFQGKASLLQVGRWFILSGTRSVMPVR